MNIIEKKLSEIKPYENNPRKNDEAVKYVANSIKEFGFKVPIVIDKDGIIVCGHTRWKAAKKLKLKSVPCILADDLNDEQIKAFRLADNKTGEIAIWDDELLEKELNGILNFEMEDFGFDFYTSDDEDENDSDEDKENIYTSKTEIPQYEPTGEDVPLNKCYDMDKTNELINEIKASNISEEEKTFLTIAAYRHVVFNYRNIAEYYANADKNVQELMEKSALVIIDIDNAIANGYVRLSKELEKLRSEQDDKS